MPQRFVRPTDRRVFVAIGAWAVVMGALLLADSTANDEVWLANLWPLMLVTGGVSTLLYALRIQSFRLRGFSNAVLVVACAGRGAAAVLGVLGDTAASIPRALAEVAVFSMLAFLLYVTWRSRVPRPRGATWDDT